MEDKVSYWIKKEEIRQQNMQLIVINRQEKQLNQSQEAVRQNMERELFQVFHKYV